MTVSELRAELQGLPDDMEVILQKDAEGNGYSPLYVADPDAVYIADTTYSGDVYSMDWSHDDACMSKAKWKKIKAMPRCLVLAPVN